MAELPMATHSDSSVPFLTTVVGSLPKPPWLQEKLPLNAEGKQVHGKGAAWAFEGDCDPQSIQSSSFSLEWRPRTGQTQELPASDKADWFEIDAAKA